MCAGVHACACVHACVCAVTYRQKDDLVHKLHYDAANKLYHIIYLSFPFSLYLPIYIRTHTHTHIHIYVCLCVCLDALTLDEEQNFIYLKLSHINK